MAAPAGAPSPPEARGLSPMGGCGVLLFYRYAPTQVAEESEWQRERASALRLNGRIRVAPHGLNGTLSGPRAQLLRYIEEYTERDPTAKDVDWKLSSTQADKCFSELIVRIVSEIVSLGVSPEEAPLDLAADHLSPSEFHQLLSDASMRDAGAGTDRNSTDVMAPDPTKHALGGTSRGSVVLLDTRNCYEWEVGRFELPGVKTLLPPIRQFSDLPRWLDSQLPVLKDCTVLMYCTGGVRCETASSYLRRKSGNSLSAVHQLFGGIERYLEAFPDGGYFKGKNLVFDKRLTVGPPQAEVVGRCTLCKSPTDDYSASFRCTYCRLRLLVCVGCSSVSGLTLTCQQCAPAVSKEQKTSGGVAKSTGTKAPDHRWADANGDADPTTSPPYRLLCLHGFRQNASGFRGRCAQLQRKLGSVAQLIFIDAPHSLAFQTVCGQEMINAAPTNGLSEEPCAVEKGYAADISTVGEVSIGGRNSRGRRRRAAGKRMPDKSVESVSRVLEATQNPSEVTSSPLSAHLPEVRCDFLDSASSQQRAPAPKGQHAHSRPRYSWLLEESCIKEGGKDGFGEPSRVMAKPSERAHDAADGWEGTLSYLRAAFLEHGPFDGILGFSLGASVAAALASLRDDAALSPISFRFVVLVSGHVAEGSTIQRIVERRPIRCPSLHIVGRSDKVVHPHASADLARCFDAASRKLFLHDGGHLVPASDTCAAALRSFIRGSSSRDLNPRAADVLFMLSREPEGPPPSDPPPMVIDPIDASTASCSLAGLSTSETCDSTPGNGRPLPQRTNRRKPRGGVLTLTESGADERSDEKAAQTSNVIAPLGDWALEDAPEQFEYLDHTADVQLHSWGRTLEEAFEQQVLAIMGLITELSTVSVHLEEPRAVSAEGHDLLSLLYNFLDECLFLFNAELFVTRRIHINHLDREKFSINAVCVGERFELGRHPQGIEVKAITYSAMRINQEGDRTDILVIVDI